MIGRPNEQSGGDDTNAQHENGPHTEYVMQSNGGAAALTSASTYADHDIEKSYLGKIPYVSTKAEVNLVRKIVFTLMPFVVCITVMQYADKSALSASAVLGIYADTHITSTQFSWLASIFFIGHLVCQPINNILLQKLPIRRYTGACITVWGTIMIATSYCRNFSQLFAMRILLGLFEGTSLPSVYLIVSTLFRRSEQATYYGIVTIANGLGIIFSALIAYGVSQMGNQRGIFMWRWSYIILGAITMLLGVLCFFFLVDKPKSRLLRLTENEEKIVDERTEDNAVVRHKEIKWSQMLEALIEARFWCMCIATIGINMQGAGIQVFSVQLISTLGDFTPGESILLKMPSGVILVLNVMLATFFAQRTQQLCYTSIFMSLFSLAGCIILATAASSSVKLVGYYLTVFSHGAYSVIPTVIGTNVYGYTKKIFYNGALVVCSTLGSFIGPLIMLEREAPGYKSAMMAYCIGNGVAIASILVMRIAMATANSERTKNPATPSADVTLDLTDVQDRSITYRL